MATTTRTASTGTAAAPRRGRPGRRLEGVVHHGLLGLLALAWLVPVLWMVSMALTPDQALQRSSVGLVPNGLPVIQHRPRWPGGQGTSTEAGARRPIGAE